MAPDPRVTAYLDANYPSPRVDPEWLGACYDWVLDHHNLTPATDMPTILHHVEAQLLQSDLSDSMAHGTGIPLNILQAPCATLRGPVLVEMTAITEVGSSALALDAVRVVRDERMNAGAGAEGEEEEADLEVDGEGPVPNYPRSMLRFELSDGATTLSAFEYRSIPDIVLGETPLGCFSKTFSMAVQDADFARGLRRRMGRLEPEEEHQPPPAPPPPPVQVRSPLRQISRPPSPIPDLHQHADDEDQPRRRRVPTPPPAVTSAYFSPTNNPPPPRRGDMGLALQSARSGPIDIVDSDSENDAPARRAIVPLKSSARKPQPVLSEDEYGDDAMMDDAFLEELQRVEEQGMPPAPSRSTRRGSSGSGDVITIDDDDDDMEDKENVPAPQRHVRRRVTEEVIDISDSD
ncbi:DUF1767 domain-containing protein [Mycena kentingensis (nom. inval.)]|nr:DUF1767 domain-containing protein [Mycena kentingensis (nom. inval.)]